MPLTIITLKKAPPSLRGDLTKWMQEIATGVYVGNFNSRVRELLWKRVKESIKDGEATLTFAARNEIGYAFETHQCEKIAIDLDGIPVVFTPKRENKEKDHLKTGFSKAARFRKTKKFQGATKAKKDIAWAYVVLDIETSGLDSKKNEILEIAALKVRGEELSEFHEIINFKGDLPQNISKLTGLTMADFKEGQPIALVLEGLVEFVGDDPIVGYNVKFDLSFVNENLRKSGFEIIRNKSYDLMRFVKKEKPLLANYKLESVLRAYEIFDEVPHRALGDVRLIYRLSKKVNKFQVLLKRDRPNEGDL